MAVLAAAVGMSLPAEAQKRKNPAKPAEVTLPDPADGEHSDSNHDHDDQRQPRASE